MDNTKIGCAIGKYMDLQDLSVPDMAKKTGLHRDTIYKYLSGKRGMTLASLAKIAEALDVPVAVLIQ